MADYQNIDTGAFDNDPTADEARTAFQKIEANTALFRQGDKNPSVTRKVFELSDSKLTGISDDTYFDLMSFDLAATTTSKTYGTITGRLTVTILSRDTGGLSASQHLYYRLSLVRGAAGVLQLTLTVEGSDKTGAEVSVASSLQEKAGTTDQNMILEFKFTHTNFDTDVARVFCTYEGQAFGITEAVTPMPTFLI